MHALKNFRGQEFIGVDELTAAAAALIRCYRDEPARGNVRRGITTRIVRHYLAENLLGEPTGQSGAATVFNYGNLLRLLAVKKLLADHWSVIKIKEFMLLLDITALEQLVAGTLASPGRTNDESPSNLEVTARDAAASGLRTIQRNSPGETANGSNYTSAAATTALDLVSFNSPPPPSLASTGTESAARSEAAPAVEWIELATGLEIKIRRSFRPPRNEHERERLVARFRSIIKSRDEYNS